MGPGAAERRPGAGCDADNDGDRAERGCPPTAMRPAQAAALAATAFVPKRLGPLLGALAPALHRLKIEVVASAHVPIVSRIRKSARSYQSRAP